MYYLYAIILVLCHSIICAAVLPPTNVSQIAVTSRSIEITWEPSLSTNVIGYLISYTTSASYADGGSVTVNNTDIRSHTLTDLEEDTSYTITMQATSDEGKSANSSEVLVRTYTDSK